MLLLAALLAAAPALAQPAPPPPPPGHHGGGPGMPGRDQRKGERMFPSMSEAGRATIREAMMAGGDRRADRAKVEAARERMMAALDADRFDAAAVKRAMDEERALAEATKLERQAAMLAAFGKLSAADRKAFVADSRAMKDRMDKRMRDWRERVRDRRDRRGAPPPPPPQESPAPGLDSDL
ncbi:periplasmic heavy metal sensor [Sandarakinorhabdus sp.]|uniref:periplasmic heavy metal sensor n=1 Tax=Sandarakinorhabdus sp. TaxID=1916663 RepID=UPI0033412251